ncbi:MAG: ankyrin repeat domain-containing protein [Proteobacteria bacterium]|nr:ankyrin repeat domain-containing protein [Pseudomonadota bacterium]
MRTSQLLLAHGAKADTGKGDDASLVLATQRGDAAMVSLLLRSGASPETTDATGYTALWHAACRDDAAVLALLLGAGANVNAAAADGVTPIACAAARGNDAAFDKLLRAGAEVQAPAARATHFDARGSRQPRRDRAQAGRIASWAGCAEHVRRYRADPGESGRRGRRGRPVAAGGCEEDTAQP